MSRSVRNRGQARALRLAKESEEYVDLRRALWLVKRAERGLQRIEEIKIRRGSRKLAKVVSEEKTTTPSSREDLKDIIGDVIHCLQRNMTRYELKKNRTASFSVRISREQFMKLWGGYATITSSASGDRLRAVLTGVRAQEVTDKFGKALGVGAGLDNWVIRRMYGSDVNQKRDCSFVHVVPDNNYKNKIFANWRLQQTSQLDITGIRRETEMPTMRVRFPRKCVPTSTFGRGKTPRRPTGPIRKRKRCA